MIPEARIGEFPVHPAPAPERPHNRLSGRDARVSSLQRNTEAQGRKMSSARKDRGFPELPGEATFSEELHYGG
jgi:hypothetical protein